MSGNEGGVEVGNQMPVRADLGAGIAETDYEIGYGHPPKQFQFQPGQSGNPKGRPPGRPNIKTMVERVINQRIPIRQGEETREMPLFQAVLYAQGLKGAKGDARSAGVFFKIAEPKNENETEQGGASLLQPVGMRPSAELFENVDPTRLSEDEMVELSRLAGIVELGGGMTALSVKDFARARDIVNKGRGKDITPNA
jgi:uncharacterized protein DUF5681